MIEGATGFLMVLGLLLALSAGPAESASGGGGGSDAFAGSLGRDPDWQAAMRAVDERRYKAAIPLLQAVAGRFPDNAGVWNYLGYSYRQSERYDEAKASYGRALAIEPKHRGANEYLGELYLRLGNPEAAEARLAVLDSACFFGCEEYDELKAAIAEYRRTGHFSTEKAD